jgi:hypothetical protein
MQLLNQHFRLLHHCHMAAGELHFHVLYAALTKALKNVSAYNANCIAAHASGHQAYTFVRQCTLLAKISASDPTFHYGVQTSYLAYSAASLCWISAWYIQLLVRIVHALTDLTCKHLCLALVTAC